MSISNKIKLINYLVNSNCSDKKSINEALKWEKVYLNNLDKRIPSNYYAIYDVLKMIPSNINLYDNFLKKLESKFELDCNILEVGGGNLPRIAERIAKKQLDIGCGSITVIDSNLAINNTKYSNLKLCRNEFTLDTDISNFGLIIGLFPCEATEVIVHKSLINNKSFFIRLCDCIHPFDDFSEEEYNFYLTHPQEYYKLIVNTYKYYTSKFNRKMETINEETPIIYSKKK